ncbi:hypothetical protein M1466_01025 [Candidatus Dependentiae bacterium]|nr:hypothetical protein [Candidatus Dependentiae bacterium]
MERHLQEAYSAVLRLVLLLHKRQQLTVVMIGAIIALAAFMGLIMAANHMAVAHAVIHAAAHPITTPITITNVL